jgi:hypothetical protein
MQFQDELAAGVTLVRPALQSPDYVAGASGWAINLDGSAEFSNATVRGTVTATNAAGDYAMISPSAPSGVADATAPGLLLSKASGDVTPASLTEFDDTFNRGIYLRSSSAKSISSSVVGVDYSGIQMTGKFHGQDPNIIITAGDAGSAPTGGVSINGTFFDATGAIAAYGGGWTTYTPVMTGYGSATFTQRTGYWRRIGDGIQFVAYFVVGVAGSGATVLNVTAPTAIDRTTRQLVPAHLESLTTGNNGCGTVYAAQGGSGNVFDRIRNYSNSSLTGADLLSTGIITIQGWYREQL